MRESRSEPQADKRFGVQVEREPESDSVRALEKAQAGTGKVKTDAQSRTTIFADCPSGDLYSSDSNLHRGSKRELPFASPLTPLRCAHQPNGIQATLPKRCLGGREGGGGVLWLNSST